MVPGTQWRLSLDIALIISSSVNASKTVIPWYFSSALSSFSCLFSARIPEDGGRN